MIAQKLESKRSRRGINNNGTDNLDDNAPANSLVTKVTCLEKDLERRQESYVARERAYKTRIQELEEELLFVRQTKTGWMKSDGKMSKLKSMQGQIMKNVELVQDRTSRVLQEQERDLLRAFRARLFDVQTELEKEKSKKEDGAGAWIERSRKLESEVEWAKEVADRLERVNQTLLIDNSRLKSQFNSQEEDRNFLIAQLVNVKKENAQLKAEYSAISAENEALQYQMKRADEEMKSGVGSSSSAGNIGAGSAGRHGGHRDTVGIKSHSNDAATDDRYKEINMRLRRLLTEERRALQNVRTNYATELRSRTEMEMLLRQCVDDVRKEISLRTYTNPANLVGSRPSSSGGHQHPVHLSTSSFTQTDRERSLELLLSQERVISLIYTKTFPINSTGKPKNTGVTPLDISSGATQHDGGPDSDILLAISKGLSQNSALYNVRDHEHEGDGLSISEGGGGPLIAAALMNSLTNDISEFEGTRLPAI